MTTPRPRARRSDRAPDRAAGGPRRDTSRGFSAIPSTLWVLEPDQRPRDAVVGRLQHWSSAPNSATPSPVLALTVVSGHVAPTSSSTGPPTLAVPRTASPPDGVDAGRAGRAHRSTSSSGTGPGSGSGPWNGPARPFWADMVAAASVGPGRHPLPITSPRGGSPAAGSGEASLLVVEHGSAEAGDDLGYRAAQLLAPGGLLAVLSQHDREPAGETGQAGAASGVSTLRDPTGSIVASAQNADLLYLQHIVLVPRHPTALHVAANTTRPSRPVGVPESLDATGEHIDLCLFLRPPAPILAAGAA